jgi:hypothetical protein
MYICKFLVSFTKILSRPRGVTIDAVWVDELDLLVTRTHHSELQVISALSLILTLYKSLDAKSSTACSVPNNR